jgi:hypothetical protein
MKGGPVNVVYTSSSSGWMEKEQLIQWPEFVFIPETMQISGNKHFLLLDGHGSHVALRAVKVCLENITVLICLPAHSSIYYNRLT